MEMLRRPGRSTGHLQGMNHKSQVSTEHFQCAGVDGGKLTLATYLILKGFMKAMRRTNLETSKTELKASMMFDSCQYEVRSGTMPDSTLLDSSRTDNKATNDKTVAYTLV
ncbi:hypothetical protein CBL_07125 [Carabus blaptoides fortunei]